MAQTKELLNYFTGLTLASNSSSSTYQQANLGPFQLYQKYLFALQRSGDVLPFSYSVQHLTKAVVEAQAALELSQGHPCSTTNLQISIIQAGNWLRRFTYERNRVNSWYDDLEAKERLGLVLTLEQEASSLLLQISPPSTQAAMQDKAMQVAARLQAKHLSQEEEKGEPQALACQLAQLDLAVAHVHETISILRFFVREVMDHTELSLEQQHKVDQAKQILKATGLEMNPPAWRNPNTLGPFGVATVVDAEAGNRPWLFLRCQFNLDSLRGKRKNKWFTTTSKWANQLHNELNQPTKVCGTYELDLNFPLLVNKYIKYQVNGKVAGCTSPLFAITIPTSDPTFELISIPPLAKYFCWAHPVVDTKNDLGAGVFTLADLFLVLGGFVYFDCNMAVICCNALVPSGSQLQFTSAAQLPQDVYQALEIQNRFRAITLEGLGEATHFAWVLPGEFSQPSWKSPLPKFHAGAFAYKYEGDPSRNNYFVLATAAASLGEDNAAVFASLV
ncbi:hypothetical protein BASA81_009117 [Batrachochytrium salamandrivorans]|nr:hypothetical protein BASA81_009117 [Batrachochytrium salamandrivorans]